VTVIEMGKLRPRLVHKKLRRVSLISEMEKKKEAPPRSQSLE
jgi:hypothetical protein